MENRITGYTKTTIDKLLRKLIQRIPTKTSDIQNDNGFIDNTVNNLVNYNLTTETGSQITLNIDTDYKMMAILKDKNSNVIYTSNVIDLPLETMIINVEYDNSTKEIVLTLQNGNTARFSVADLVDGLVSGTQLNTILANYYSKIEIDNLLNNKVDKVTGKGLSTEDYTTAEKAKLSNIEANAEANIIEDVKVNGTSQEIVNKAIDISVPTKTSDILNDSGFIDKNVNDLVNYELKITPSNKLNADLVDDTSSTNKFTNATDITAWNAKYNKPNTGIPKTDLANDVQASLNKADTAIQAHQDITGKEDKSNKVTAINAQSTDEQYPSAKCVYDRVVELQEENELLRKDISGLPTDTANGESIDITDSAEMRFEQFEVGGNSKQTQYSGKNSFNIDTDITNLGITVNMNKSELLLNGTSQANNYIINDTTKNITLPAGTYTFSSKVIQGSFSTNNKDTAIELRKVSDRSIIFTLYAGINFTLNQTITFSEDTTIYYTIYINGSGFVFNNLKLAFQIEKGSTSTEYEPYTGGQPSPNPDYPQEIHSVGDNGSANVTVGNKNFADNVWEQGTINVDTGAYAYVSNAIVTTNFIPINPNVEYYISRTIATNYMMYFFYDKNKRYINKHYDIDMTSSLSTKNMQPNNYSQIIKINTKNVAYMKISDVSNDLSTKYLIQLNSNSNKNYIDHAHQTYTIPTQQPMRKIGDYADAFVKQNGVWYEKHVIGNVVLDGSDDEGWVVNETNNNTMRFVADNLIRDARAIKEYSLYMMNNSFVQYNGNTGIGNIDIEGIAIRDNLSGFTIRALISRVTDLSGFKIWLSAHNVIINYVLQNPTLLPCTAEQTAILEEICKKAKTYKGGTHIYSIDEISPNFDVEYHVDLNTLITRIEELEGGV